MNSTSVDELRAEARRLRETVDTVSDPALKREFASRALELSERAEAIERSIEDPSILRANIARYRAMLAGNPGLDDAQKPIVQQMLADAETLLDNLLKKTP